MSDDIEQLKEQEKQQSEPHRARRKKQHGRASFAFPIFLIIVGGYFLLRNFGLVDLTLNWWVLGRFWPLFLVFAGLNIIAEQIRGGLGRLFKAFVSLAFWGTFAGLLLFADQLPYFSQHLSTEMTEHSLVVARDRAESATVELNFSGNPVTVSKLVDSPNLFEGTISTAGDVRLDSDVFQSEAEMSFGTHKTFGQWGSDSLSATPWTFYLNNSLPLDLTLNLSYGRSDLQLQELMLDSLKIDASSGATFLQLPNGDYSLYYDVGSGIANVELPAVGRQEIAFDGGSGRVQFYLPPTAEARITIDDGSGYFSPSAQLRLVDGSERGDGVWETPNFDPNAENAIFLTFDIGSGSLSIDSDR